MNLLVLYIIAAILGGIGGMGAQNFNVAKVTSGIHFIGVISLCIYIINRYHFLNIIGLIIVSMVACFISFVFVFKK